MPDPTNPGVPPATTPAAQRGPTIHIGDEFGTAKRNLPPAKIVLAAIGAVLVVAGVIAFLQRAKPQGAGSLDNVAAVDLPGQNSVLVAFTFTLENSGKKSLWIHDIHGKVVTSTGESSGEAVSAVDFERYYQAFPALKANTQPALAPEDKLQPGQAVERTIMVSFPVNLDAFNQ
ncbi:MAG: hypothetical protein ACLQLC_10710, partial [Candidatus Sulfotelmatobacter sp.]